jgi:hypothetical protein
MTTSRPSTQPFSGAAQLVDKPIPRTGTTTLEFREPQ